MRTFNPVNGPTTLEELVSWMNEDLHEPRKISLQPIHMLVPFTGSLPCVGSPSSIVFAPEVFCFRRQHEKPPPEPLRSPFLTRLAVELQVMVELCDSVSVCVGRSCVVFMGYDCVYPESSLFGASASTVGEGFIVLCCGAILHLRFILPPGWLRGRR